MKGIKRCSAGKCKDMQGTGSGKDRISEGTARDTTGN